MTIRLTTAEAALLSAVRKTADKGLSQKQVPAGRRNTLAGLARRNYLQVDAATGTVTLGTAGKRFYGSD